VRNAADVALKTLSRVRYEMCAVVPTSGRVEKMISHGCQNWGLTFVDYGKNGCWSFPIIIIYKSLQYETGYAHVSLCVLSKTLVFVD